MSPRRYGEPLPLGEPGGLPYSKGLMARALVAAGVSIERAYELATRIELDLAERDARSTDLDRVEELACEVLGFEEGSDVVRRLRRYAALHSLDLPILLFVGGATGTGKSTVATEAAHRLGITRVTSTDFIRQTMRAFFSRGVHAVGPLLELRGRAVGRRRRDRRPDDPRLPRADAERARRRRRRDPARAHRGLVDGARGRAPRARDGAAAHRRRARRQRRARDRERGRAPHALPRPRHRRPAACARWTSTSSSSTTSAASRPTSSAAPRRPACR